VFDAHTNTFKDSNVNPNVKAMEEEKVKVHTFTCNTLGVKKGMLKLQDGD
jgi:hypothetical protein